MAKQLFANGVIVSSAYLNSIFGVQDVTQWQASNAYSVGDVVLPTTLNDHAYVCTVPGVTDTTEPTWPTTGDGTVVDNAVTWKEVGGFTAIWAASTSYEVGDVVIPATPNGYMYRCTVAGTSDSSAPSWPTSYPSTVADNTVTWELFKGHRHDGLAGQGSAQKIVLTSAAEVSGQLPLANMVSHVHDGSDRPKVSLTTAAHVTGVLPLANMASHTHDGSSRDKIDPADHIDGSSDGTGTITLPATQFTTEQTVNFHWHRIFDSQGVGIPGAVRLTIAALSATSNANNMGTTTTPLPADIRPSSNVRIPCLVIDNGNVCAGLVEISSAGNIAWAMGAVSGTALLFSGTGFTNSGTKGFEALEIWYPLW